MRWALLLVGLLAAGCGHVEEEMTNIIGDVGGRGWTDNPEYRSRLAQDVIEATGGRPER